MGRPGRPIRADAKTAITKRVNLSAKEDLNYTALAQHMGMSFSDLARLLLREKFLQEMSAPPVTLDKAARSPSRKVPKR